MVDGSGTTTFVYDVYGNPALSGKPVHRRPGIPGRFIKRPSRPYLMSSANKLSNGVLTHEKLAQSSDRSWARTDSPIRKLRSSDSWGFSRLLRFHQHNDIRVL